MSTAALGAGAPDTSQQPSEDPDREVCPCYYYTLHTHPVLLSVHLTGSCFKVTADWHHWPGHRLAAGGERRRGRGPSHSLGSRVPPRSLLLVLALRVPVSSNQELCRLFLHGGRERLAEQKEGPRGTASPPPTSPSPLAAATCPQGTAAASALPSGISISCCSGCFRRTGSFRCTSPFRGLPPRAEEPILPSDLSSARPPFPLQSRQRAEDYPGVPYLRGSSSWSLDPVTSSG